MASSVLGMDETAGQPSVTAQDPWTAERIRRLSHSRSLDSINGAAPSEKAQAPAMNGAVQSASADNVSGMAQPIEGEDGKDRPNPGFWDFHDDQDADDDPFGAGEEEDGRAIEGPPQGGGGDAAAGVRNDVGGGDA